MLLQEAARYSYVVTARSKTGAPLGVLSDGSKQKSMAMAGNGYTCALAQWKIEEEADRTPHLISEETYKVLSRGSLNEDGTIAYDGQKYRIKAYWDGSQSIAEAYIV